MRSLQEALERCSGVDIERVARLWGVTEEVPPLMWVRPFLGQTMRSREHARFVWEQLSADERVVLYQVLQTRGKACSITREDLVEATGLDAVSASAALTRLASCLLVLEDPGPAPPGRGRSSGEPGQPAKARGGTLFAIEEAASSLAETGEELFGGGDPTARSLADMLRPLSRVQLAHLAQAHCLSSDGGGAEAGDPSRSLASALCAPLVILETLRGIDPPLYRLCFWLYDQGGRATMQAVRASTYAGSNGSALEWLLRSLSGLALAFDTLSPGGGRHLFMPGEVYAALRRDLDACAAVLAALQAPPPGAPGWVQDRGPLLLYDLAVPVGEAVQNDLELTREERLHKRHADRIRPRLHGRARTDRRGEDQYLFLLCQFALQQGLLQVVPADAHKTRAVLGVGASLDGFAALPLADQIKETLGWWTQTDLPFDACWGEIVQRDSFTWQPAPARELLLSYLRGCRPGTWHTIRSLLETLWELGLVALAGREGAGAWPGEPAPSPLIVLPTFEVHLLLTDLRAVYALLPTVEVEQVERTSRFRLTRRSIEHALRWGLGGEEIVTLLKRHLRDGDTLPQPVEYSIREWASLANGRGIVPPWH